MKKLVLVFVGAAALVAGIVWALSMLEQALEELDGLSMTEEEYTLT